MAGLDEVGRGPLAGPVVAAAVILPQHLPTGLGDLLADSKTLRPAARARAFQALLASDAEIGVGAASVDEIARLNILHASMLAMQRAFARLLPPPDHALIDGNRAPALPCATQCLVGGDGIEMCIAAASIAAKVIRDRAMARLDLRHPGYGWASNSGYGTKTHLAGLLRLGITRHHRQGFAPVAALVKVR